MARASIELVRALQNTANALQQSADYQWGHMGSCNCGFLAQQITKLDKREIHSRAMAGHGDWNEQLNDYCPTSGMPMDDMITELLDAGFDVEDLKHLERLTSPWILNSLPEGHRNLRHNLKADVIIYLNAWASLLHAELERSARKDAERLRHKAARAGVIAAV